MNERETCVDCGVRSPEKNEDHTLTSSMGWRLTRERLPDGTFRAAWRCRECFEKHKAAKQLMRRSG